MCVVPRLLQQDFSTCYAGKLFRLDKRGIFKGVFTLDRHDFRVMLQVFLLLHGSSSVSYFVRHQRGALFIISFGRPYEFLLVSFLHPGNSTRLLLVRTLH